MNDHLAKIAKFHDWTIRRQICNQGMAIPQKMQSNPQQIERERRERLLSPPTTTGTTATISAFGSYQEALADARLWQTEKVSAPPKQSPMPVWLLTAGSKPRDSSPRDAIAEKKRRQQTVRPSRNSRLLSGRMIFAEAMPPSSLSALAYFKLLLTYFLRRFSKMVNGGPFKSIFCAIGGTGNKKRPQNYFPTGNW